MSGRLTRGLIRTLDAVRLARRPPAQPAHLETGRRGEEEAYFYLRRQGYLMVARNWRSPRRHGEVDLVGWDGDVLCFVEVKTRTTRAVKPAEAADDERTREELAAVARWYLRRLARPVRHRFDVLSIYIDKGPGPPSITLFKNAFSVA